MAVMPKRPQLRPFRYGTRRRMQPIATITYDGTAAQRRPQPIQIFKVGYLSSLWISIKGTIAFGAGQVLGPDGLAGLIERIQVTTNLGSASLVDLSGPGIDLVNRWLTPMGPRSAPVDLVGATPCEVEYYLRVPIAANNGRNFELGLINLQDPQIQVTLALTFAALTNVVTTATGGALTIEVFYQYFEVPDPRAFAQPPRAIVRSLEESLTGLAASPAQNLYEIPRLGTMLQIGGIAYVNGVRADIPAGAAASDVQQTFIRFNKTDVIETRDALLHTNIDASTYGMVEGSLPGETNALGLTGPVTGAVRAQLLQRGAYTYDFWSAEGLPSSGDLRDAIDTEELTTTEYGIVFKTGAALQATDQVRFIRRVVQSLQ